MTLIKLLFLLGPLAVVPLGLWLIRTPDREGLDPLPYLAARRLLPWAAAAVALSFLLPEGLPAALLAVPWLILTLLGALFGLWRLLPRGLTAPEEAAIDAGLLLLPVGAVWLIASRGGWAFLGFTEPIVLLTAVHFHFAAFGAPVIAGLVGRRLLALWPGLRPLYSALLLAVVAGTPLVAIGTVKSLWLEAVGALILALGLGGVALLTLFHLPRLTPRPAIRITLGLAACSAIAAMLLAVLYAGGRAVDSPVIDIAGMARYHGLANGLGFVLTGLCGLAMLRPAARMPAPGVPLSRLSATGQVGASYFSKIGALAAGRPEGLIDSVEALTGAAQIHPGVRAFFEATSRIELDTTPTWAPGAGVLARIWNGLAERFDQLRLPVQPEPGIANDVVALDTAMDGRPGTRGSIRIFPSSGKLQYASAYHAHCAAGQGYMGCTFPLPGGNFAAVHRAEACADGGLLLTTIPRPDRPGDEGCYFANRWVPVRLPIHDRIRLRPPVPEDGEDTVAMARQEMFLFGRRFLILDYRIRLRKEGAEA